MHAVSRPLTPAVGDTVLCTRAMLSYAFLWSQGGAWFDCAAMSSNVVNFEYNRGYVLGLLKSCVGLSSSMIALAYACLYAPSTGATAQGSLGVLGWLAAFTGLGGIAGEHAPPPLSDQALTWTPNLLRAPV